MEKVQELLEEVILNHELISGVLSDNKRKDEIEYNKVTIKPVSLKGDIQVQFTYKYDKKVTHSNLSYDAAIEEILSLMDKCFKQTVLFTTEADYQIFTKKQGKERILKNKPTKEVVDFSHNKKKKYIIQEGTPCSFLAELGVMDKEGKVYKKKYNKFRQINRFLEMVSDVVDSLDSNKRINIIDFGCGKSYLTFGLYYYLVDIKGLDVNIVGLDLKQDVINTCNGLSNKLEFSNLKFIHGDIKDYKDFESVDMVVTLHACDTATDDALVKAVNWDADVILSVPCCQHELFNKIHNPIMKPMEKHGIIKERMSALITDCIRANVLEILGYSTQIMEFIDMEHTPKNILIRAIKDKSKKPEVIKEYLEFKKFWNIEPYIESAMGRKLEEVIKQHRV